MEHIVSIKNFNVFNHTISCELEFASIGERKSFYVLLKFEDRISDCASSVNLVFAL